MWRVRRAARLRQKDDADRDLVIAWNVEYVRLKTQNDKRMPTLQQLLSRGKGPRQTPEQHLSILQMMSAHTGIPLREVKKPA